MLSRIQRGQFAADGKLPSENDLSQHFGVSRPIVREALRRLRTGGLIESRQGAGSFVMGPHLAASRPLPGAPRPPVQSISDVRRIYEFRLALEGEIAFSAALHRTDPLVDAIKGALDAIEAAIEANNIGVQQDDEFHQAVARATQNPLFEAALIAVRPQLNYLIDLARSFSAMQSAEHLAMVQREHMAVFEGIRDGDPVRAREAMQAHIRNAQERVFDGIHL